MRRFELVEGTSNKFWEIELKDTSFDVRWGRIGTSGQSQTKEFATAEKARAAHDKLVKEKTDKGYSEVVGSAAPAASAPAASAPAKPAAKPAKGAAPVAPPAPVGPATTAPVTSPVIGVPGVGRGSVVLTDPSTWPRERRAELWPAPGWTEPVALDRAGIWASLRRLVTERSRPMPARLKAESPATAPASIDEEMDVAKALWPEDVSWRSQEVIHEVVSLLVDHWWVTGGPAHALAAISALLTRQATVTHSQTAAWARLRLHLATLSPEARAPLAALPMGDGSERARAIFAALFPETGEGDRLVLAGTKERAAYVAISQLATAEAVSKTQYPFYMLRQSIGAAWRDASVRPTLLTWLATFGAPAVGPIVRLLDVEGDADARRDIADVLAFAATGEAIEALASRASDRLVLGALREVALAQPDLALAPLVKEALGRSAAAATARTILAQVLRAEGASLDASVASLSEAGRKLVSELRLSSEAKEEASLDELPPLLSAPPWTQKKKRGGAAVVEGLAELPFEATMEWPAGLRERWSQYVPDEWAKRMVLQADAAERLWGISLADAESIARGDAAAIERLHAAARERPNTYVHAPNVAALHPALAKEIVVAYGAARWWDETAPFRKFAAEHGLAFLDAFLAYAAGHPAEGLELLRPYRSPRVAFVAADALHRLKKKPAGASAWLRAHPEAAAVGLVPIAVGKLGKPRDAAEHALRWLAKEGHEAIVMDVAARYGEAAKGAMRAVLDFDPLDLYPSKIPALPDFAEAGGLPRLVLEGSGKALPLTGMQHVLTMLQFSKLDLPYAGLEQVKSLTSLASREAFAWELFSTWVVAGAASKEAWAMTAMGLIGGDECARRITPLIRAWPGESQHQRAVSGLDVLATIGTDVALMHLHGIAQKLKFKGLQEKAREKIDQIAEARGLSADELADRLVPDLGLDDDGSRTLDFGARRFRVIFDETLKPQVRDEGGKRLPELPKPKKDDDAEKAAGATDVWKALKKDAKTVAQQQVLRLELAMCGRRRWSPAVFEPFLVKHPLMRHLVVRLVWGIYDADGRLTRAFRVAEDGSYADANDDALGLDENAVIGVAHTLEMEKETEAKFGTIFGDYELVQPFRQLSRETFALDAKEAASGAVERWKGKKLPTGKVLGLEARGWRRGQPQDAGHIGWMEKHVEGETITASLDPGIAVGDVQMFPEQQITSVCRGDEWQPKKGEGGLAGLHPIVVSEILRDIDALFA